jgi:hypothetical protein
MLDSIYCYYIYYIITQQECLPKNINITVTAYFTLLTLGMMVGNSIKIITP